MQQPRLVVPLVISILLAVIGAPMPAIAAPQAPAIPGFPFVGDGDNAPYGYEPDEVEVLFKSGRPTTLEITRFLGEQDLTLVRSFAGLTAAYAVFEMKIKDKKIDPPKKAKALQKHAAVFSASVVPLGHAADFPVVGSAGLRYGPLERPLAYFASDPHFSEQWYLHKMQAPDAWDVVGNALTIGIIDSGIEAQTELTVAGNANFSSEPDTADHLGHGTQMAGIAAAVTNNGFGIAGMTGINGAVYNFKVLDASDSTNGDRVANAIIDATDRANVWILNMSLNVGLTPGLSFALQYAYDKGRIMLASTGNANSPGFAGAYPAASPLVIAVGGSAHTNPDYRWGDARLGSECTNPSLVGSNYGSPGVSLVAPAKDVWVTRIGAGNDPISFLCVGTSGATALVSGLAAMLAIEYCTCPAFIRARMQASADKVGGYNYNWAPGQSSEMGFGRINALRAVTDSYRDDIYWYESGFQTIRVLKSTKTSLVDAGPFISGIATGPDAAGTGDFNGDGFRDVVWYQTSPSGAYSVMLSNGSSLSAPQAWLTGRARPDRLLVADVNGDGLDDIMSYEVAANGAIRVYFSTATGFVDKGPWISGQGGPDWAGMADVNRDGLKDVLWYESWNAGTIKAMLSNGSAFTDTGGWISGMGLPQWADTGDLNRDGTDDVAWFHDWKEGGAVYGLLSNGVALTNTGVSWANNLGATPTWAGTADANRDGKTDLYWYNNSTGNVRAFLSVGYAFYDGTAWITGRGSPTWAGKGNAAP